MSRTLDLEAILRIIDELAESDADPGVVLDRTADALGRAVGFRTVQGEVWTATPSGRPAGDAEQVAPGRVATHTLPGTGQGCAGPDARVTQAYFRDFIGALGRHVNG
ncbi:hypothetical protein [Streptomyces endophyticus]|uniref:GAF domain-containing protein n=1 Tax=Streptomyces endophyticus TaxID=714166 RepID=A0ABU6F580_9ACTN|nr:hypothetical protein [Streptomyces endophyticus]MEB8338807.1 hypothetical protein [Streptomyces endophyticus]